MTAQQVPTQEPAELLPGADGLAAWIGTASDRSGLRDLLVRAAGRGYVLLSEIHDLHDPVEDAADWPEEFARAARDSGLEVVDDLTDDDTGSSPAPTTPSTTDGVRHYLNAIGRVPLLTAEEEVDLAKRYQAGLVARQRLAADPPPEATERAQLRRLVRGGDAAQERLVTANLRLVVSIARRYLGRGLSLLELVQEGNLGLMRGVEKFDHTKGYKFSTYATWWIRQALTRGTANKARSVRLPVHVHELVAKIRRTEFELIQVLGRDPTDGEVAEALGLDTARLRELRLAGREVTSLDRAVGEDGDATLGDLVPDDEAIDPLEVATAGVARTELIAALAHLHERERGVIELRYGLTGAEPCTLEEIGAHYGVTRERIRQIEKKTLAKLRHPSHGRGLRDFAGD
ncbi:sigma-70 family RNA polymerase sigma factor [Nitriliruptor alkaliphilus]|uniref:sigma-70 family RNA polymerase sigma factor n=1 Tax=Nitriliruptor alkaliphilus TaxID=427918 RepID=UPI0009F9ACB3|nr:sigma-70 family RNA polymerase sigma factor [Nitriliruptor alkaliphilus]